MSAVSTRSNDSSNHRWWAIKPSATSRETSPYREKSNNGLTLNTLASAIGLKSKKHPTMVIQEPRIPVQTFLSSPIQPTRPTSTSSTGRPSSKSVSSTRSRGDSVGPRTPVDTQKDGLARRQSLLTLSDIDPFAARSIALPPLDPNRLSAYSNSSVTDFSSNKGDPPAFNRGSYGSSSSNSNYYAGDLSPISLYSETSPPLSPARRRKAVGEPDVALVSAWEMLAPGNSLTKSGSATTLTDKNRFSQPEPPLNPRPPMRARGMTDGGVGRSTRFLRTESSSLSKPVARQASTSRGGPVSAPPVQELPSPPNQAGPGPSMLLNREVAMANQSYVPRPKVTDVDDKGSSKSLRKQLSQHSLVKNTRPPSVPSTPSEPIVEKTIHKQRSFHHPRIPLPSIPLPHRHHSTASASKDDTESRRGSTSGSTRKRLFSTSSARPSTSNGASMEDDARSILSLATADNHGSLSKTLSLSTASVSANNFQSSFWDETPSSPGPSVSEWTPQRIMSPAEMAKVEARVNETEKMYRKRGLSVVSSPTSITSDEDSFSLYSPQHALPSRSNSVLSKSPSFFQRTSHSSSTPPLSSSTHSSLPIDSPRLISLAPPPRSWTRPSSSSNSEAAGFLPLTPPPRKPRRKPSAETVSRDKRRSIMRKPSFLDIGDDKDTDEENIAPVVGGSFLDLARESFDTLRSTDD
ncbi:hypothetical protein C8J56DRAFT_816458 [Mycena floridula]|nr:hypothetical protein C8J56DRAFT_816458 [Mycena floridula]